MTKRERLKVNLILTYKTVRNTTSVVYIHSMNNYRKSDMGILFSQMIKQNHPKSSQDPKTKMKENMKEKNSLI